MTTSPSITDHLLDDTIPYQAPLAAPIFLLAPPRSFTTVVSAMLGQHPQLYGLPEMHLFSSETILQWWRQCAEATFDMDHGAVRVVAQLIYGEQTAVTVQAARGWLRRRANLSTGAFIEMLADVVRPRLLVDKSPSIVYSRDRLRRLHEMFPNARYIHLLRHPRGHGESVMKYLKERRAMGPLPDSHWLLHLAAFPESEMREELGVVPESLTASEPQDPQRGWYVLNVNIVRFLDALPDWQKYSIKGEDVITDPDRYLLEICHWLGIRDDSAALSAMKHPEESPFARYGPPGALFGNDRSFLQSPALRSTKITGLNVDAPMPWSQTGAGFAPEVRQLAKEFGYH